MTNPLIPPLLLAGFLAVSIDVLTAYPAMMNDSHASVTWGFTTLWVILSVAILTIQNILGRIKDHRVKEE